MHDLSTEPVSGFVRRHPPTVGGHRPIGRYYGRLAAAIVACVASISPLEAADIKDGFAIGEVVLEGSIVSGDYDKLLSFVDTNGARSIYLASPGGSVTEAIKIGRLVRALRLETLIPVQVRDDLREKLAERHKLTNPKANYVCASACFFVFVAGVKRDHAFGDPILGIHRPYLTDGDLRSLSGNQAMSSASQLRSVVENYLKEMGVPAKYADLMFSVPKEEVRWISSTDFETDLEGIVPELKDWVDARCDTRTDVEKAAWVALKHKSPAQMTVTERSISKMLLKKMSALDECGSKALSDLSHQAHLKMFFEPRRTALCAEYRSDGRLDARLAAAVPNEASAAALRDDAQNATLCGDYASRAKIIRALAERGDAGAQNILGAMYFYGGTHTSQDSISQDKPEGVKWFRRAADQGDAEAQGQLSFIYLNGDGVPQNYVEALKWQTLRASQNKDRDDDTLREMFISKMTPQQIAEAQRLASQWQPTRERSDRDRSNALPAKNKAPWWQFWK